MSQAHTTFIGYFLGYQGLEKEPELFVSKPPQWKFSSARKGEETPSERGSHLCWCFQRGQRERGAGARGVCSRAALLDNKNIGFGDPSEFLTLLSARKEHCTCPVKLTGLHAEK